MSVASGCGLLVLDLPLLCFLGELLIGDAGSTERLGSRANEFMLESVLELAESMYESTRFCGPNENEEPSEPRCRELEGEWR